jgi:hypothetical protein
MGKGGLVTYEASDFFKLLFQIRGSIFDNVLSKVRPWPTVARQPHATFPSKTRKPFCRARSLHRGLPRRSSGAPIAAKPIEHRCRFHSLQIAGQRH